MEINVIRGATPQLMNAMLFHGAGQQAQAWLAEQYHTARSSMTDMGRSLLDAATEVSRRMVDPNLMLKARAMMRKVGGLFHPNTIMPLTSVEALQNAKPIMQRYVMSNGPIREMYHKQRLDGFSGDYADHHPGLVGDWHYDYRRVMNGVAQDYQKEDGTEGWRVSMYPDDLEEGDRELEIDEQAIILDAWMLATAAIKAGIDPTDVLNGKL